MRPCCSLSRLLLSAVLELRAAAPRLPAPAAVDRYFPLARRSAANPPHAAAAVE